LGKTLKKRLDSRSVKNRRKRKEAKVEAKAKV
jgi:hypothetical protein